MDEKESKALKVPNIFKPYFEEVPGMENLKAAMANIYNMQQAVKRRYTRGLGTGESPYHYNLLVVGPSGSGKTTAAHIIGKCYCKIGLISDPEPFTTDYQALLSTSAAETATNVKNLMESAVDRMILIENVEDFDDNVVYSAGAEMIDQIVAACNQAEGNIVIVATGEEKAVRDFLRKKRNFAALFNIPEIALGEYTEEDLERLANKIAKNMGYILDTGVWELLYKEYQNQKNTSDFNYLNMFKNRIIQASFNVASRLGPRSTDLEICTLKVTDFDEKQNPVDNRDHLEDLMEQLNSLVGLKAAKEQVDALIASIKLEEKQKNAGVKIKKGSMHMAFVGAPGTGKTTVARIIGKIYARMGVLSRGQFVECTRKDLVADYAGQTAHKTHSKVEEALGGVLFIDEAYDVCRGANDDFGMEAINTLTADIYDYKDDLLVILAGYQEDMNAFFARNTGLKSRIPNFIEFEDYSTEELYQIFLKYVEDSGMVLDLDTDERVRKLIEERAKDVDFGNARGIENLFNEIVKNHQKRLAEMEDDFVSRSDIKIIKNEDICLNGNRPVERKKTTEELYDELNALTGLESVKEQVRQMIAKAKVNQTRKERGLRVQGNPSLHLIFKGSAGTGKTTVARMIGDIYRSLGILPKGQLIECTRSDVVAGYVGQTALKMRDKIQQAIGGVLFIDEVYSLCSESGNDFGTEAINELVPAMENNKDNLMVIVAGYTEKMDIFLRSNPGLASRFSRELLFEDYKQKELVEIFENMLESKGLKLSQNENMTTLVDSMVLVCSKKKDFGNARGIRNLIDKLILIQECRLDKLLQEDSDDISDEMLQQITEEDINTLLEEM